jgi:radical SAM protein with 4Fe4S-binding SPASM domain
MENENPTYILAVTNSCPLHCSHCFLGDKGAQLTMSLQEAEAIVTKVMSLSNRVGFGWSGGEILALGKEYMSGLASLPCFRDQRATNGLLSTLSIELDSEWVEIIERFDTLMISLDSYHRERLGKRMQGSLSNMERLRVKKKEAAYTPSPGDTEIDLEDFYLMAMDAGAEIFHLDFLYAQNPIPPGFYLMAIDKILHLRESRKGPELGFFRGKISSLHHRVSAGFRAYDCFKGGGYFSMEGVFTSCYILYRQLRGLGVPWMKTHQFLQSKCSITSMNDRFIRDFFIKGRPGCLDCEYYPLCMGGCPFFSLFGEGGKDIYCPIYRKIFEILTS